MQLKFVNLFVALYTTIFFASMPTASAMEPENQENYFEKVGLTVKPLKITVRDEITKKCISEFENFRELRYESKNRSSEYMLIKAYILGVLKIQYQDFSQIEEWISKPVKTPPYTERSLSLPLDTLARLLNTKTPTAVTASEIEAYLKQSNEKIKAAERFDTLKYFATKVLQFNPPSLDGLSSWLLTSYDPCMIGMNRFLTCDFGLVLEIFNARAERDIHKEFEIFESDYNEKKARVRLREDLEAFFMQSGAMLMNLPPVSEILWSHNAEISLPALPKDFDISAILAEKSHHYLSGLLSNMDDRFRVFQRFIICRQHNLKEEIAHPDLYQHSLVVFKDGLLYQGGNILNTADTIWSLNPDGDLCIFPQDKSTLLGTAHHSYFFQKDNIGLPLACGGHIEVSNGKISKITNVSGHYSPSILQLILAISYFHEKGIILEDLKLEGYFVPLQNPTLKDILSISNMIQLG